MLDYEITIENIIVISKISHRANFKLAKLKKTSSFKLYTMKLRTIWVELKTSILYSFVYTHVLLLHVLIFAGYLICTARMKSGDWGFISVFGRANLLSLLLSQRPDKNIMETCLTFMSVDSNVDNLTRQFSFILSLSFIPTYAVFITYVYDWEI